MATLADHPQIVSEGAGLKVLSAHGGGSLPSYANRSDHTRLTNPVGCDSSIKLKETPIEHLRRLYFSSVIFSPEALRHLAAQIGVSQVMRGSDHPYSRQDRPVDHVVATTSLGDAEKIALLSGNAAHVFNLKA